MVLDHPALQTLSKHTSLVHWYKSLSEIIKMLRNEAKEVDLAVSCRLQSLVDVLDKEYQMQALAALCRRQRLNKESQRRALAAAAIR